MSTFHFLNSFIDKHFPIVYSVIALLDQRYPGTSPHPSICNPQDSSFQDEGKAVPE